MSDEEFVPGALEPTEGQKSAGNYRHGHKFLHGLRISVENAAGTTRRGISKSGEPWEQVMAHDYGYVRGSKGKDRDKFDVFLGPEADNPDHPVFVIDQEDIDTGEFDEHKGLIGFPDAESARAAYLSNYPKGWSADRAITAMPLAEFKKWVYKGKEGGKRLPAHQLKAFQERAEVKQDAAPQPEAPTDSYAAGGAVGKKAVPLLKHLLENGIEGVLPKLQELLGRTDKTNHEHSVVGFVENAGDMNSNRGWANMQEPQVHTDNKVGQVSLLPFGSPKGDPKELKTLNVHSHPVQSYPAPSEADMKSWGGISEAGIPGKSIILRGGSPRMAYGSIDFDPYATVDVFHPESINAANNAISEGVRKGFYDRPLKDAGIDPKEAWRVRALRNYLAGGYWEPQGIASYAHDMPSIVPSVQRMLWDRAPPGQKMDSFFSPDPELINKIIDATWNPTEDLLRNTKGFSEGGGVLPGVDPAELERHFLRGVQGRPDHECSCGNHTKMFTGPSNGPSEGFADGGEVERPAFRTPMVARRREDRQDREGAKEVPVQLLRGLLTGTLGFGGDMEGLARSVGSALGAKIDETPALPTGDFYRDLLPGKPVSASGRAASELGNMGAVPLSAGVLGGIRAARGAAPVVRGALTRMMENASREPEALIAGRRPGSARAMQSGAVKNPGGNWFGPHLERELKDLRGWEPGGDNSELIGDLFPDMAKGAEAPMSIADWMEKRAGDYVRNKMGTVKDPLLKLEAEGRLHLTPQQLAEISPGSRMTDQLHRDLTGRETRTPWETASDAQIENVGSKAALRNAQGRGVQIPDWLQRTNRPDLPYGGPSVDVYDIDPGSLERLGFGHIRDYLDQATANHDVWRSMRENPEQFQLDDTINRVRQFEGAGLLIDPAKLGKMSFADVAGKVGDWNAAMKRWEQEALAATDWNKGIKSVMKEYPETGGRWVELNPEALADEGTAMGHCVGGYCSSVESGRNRILSYRDKNGPHVTVELTPPSLTDMVKTLPQADRGAFWDEVSKKGMSNAEAQEYFKELHGELPWSIAQIKGKGNLKPIDDYIPAVQDLVRNMGPWGEIRDLENSGLLRLGKPTSDGMFNGLDIMNFEKAAPLFDRFGGYATKDELHNALKEAGWRQMRTSGRYIDPDQITPELEQFLAPKDGYASGGSVGANIGAGDTVGLGTYSPSAQGQTAPRRAADSTAGMGAGIPQQQLPQQQPLPYNANALEQWGAGINGFGNNSDILSKLPTWKVGDEAAEKDIADYIKVAHQGTDFQGMGAFLRAGPTWNSGVGGDVGDFGSWDMRTTSGADDLARQLGLGQIDWAAENPGMTGNSTLARMNDMLKDYRLIAGLTRDPNDPERAMGEGLYKNINGTWTPIAGRVINAPESHGWARSESGGSFLQAMSMMAPAVGGFAGLASAAAPSAYGAATGAIGTTATNAIINALGQYALTGNPTGALTSLFGAAGGAGGSALASSLDPAYAELGKFIGTQAGRNIGKRATT